MLELAEDRRRKPLNTPQHGSAVAAVGAALPEKTVTSAEVAARLGVDARWIETRTGIRERRVAAEGEGVVELAAKAGEKALAEAGIDPAAVDALLVATTSNAELLPAAAPRVASLLGLAGASATDLNAACTGFVSALELGSALIEAGRADRVLAIGADVLSRHVDPSDRSTAALFGDGAGAALLTAASPGRIGPVVTRADGTGAALIRAPLERPLIEMRGPDTFREAVERLVEVTAEAAALAGLELGEIDLFVYHQANARILSTVGERLGLPPERVPVCIDRYGNTSAASIPIALAEAEHEGLLERGVRVLIAAFGAGLTWGGTVIEWGAPRA